MADFIDRQVAIDAIFSEPLYESGMKKRDADEVVPAIYEKIKALPPVQISCENGAKIEGYSQDTISRQAAIDAVCMKSCGCKNKNCKNIFDIEKDEYRYCEGCDDVEILKALPPVQPERIKGHWIEITLRNHTYKCSVCGRLLVNITDGKNNVAKNYPYCHCGADMRGGKDGTN